jgi:hypothetical protein
MYINKDENVHRFELSAIRGELLEREREKEREKERKERAREREREKEMEKVKKMCDKKGGQKECRQKV